MESTFLFSACTYVALSLVRFPKYDGTLFENTTKQNPYIQNHLFPTIRSEIYKMDKIANASSVTALTANGVPVPTSRLQRGREVHAQNIRFAKRVNSKSVHDQKPNEVRGVLHKNANGWLAVALNDHGEPVAPALTNMRGYTPVRTKRMDIDALLQSFLKRLKVTRIFCNDASLLTPRVLSSNIRNGEQIIVTGYEGTFVQALEMAKNDMLQSCNSLPIVGVPNERSAKETPSYEYVRDLDPSITRAEYARIYYSTSEEDDTGCKQQCDSSGRFNCRKNLRRSRT